MVVLKKIRAATLTEALVASAIIMIVFIIASMSLNNVFQNTGKNNTSHFNNRIKELTYLARHGQIAIPYYENSKQWEIALETRNSSLTLEANHKQSKTKIITLIER